MRQIYLINKLNARVGEVMDKLLRNINDQLWREVKSQAALAGMSMTNWVEKVLAEKLRKEYLLGQKKDRRRKEHG